MRVSPLTDRLWVDVAVLPVMALCASQVYVPVFLYTAFSMSYVAIFMSVIVPLNFQVKLAGGTEEATHVSVTLPLTSTACSPVTTAASGPSADRKMVSVWTCHFLQLDCCV